MLYIGYVRSAIERGLYYQYVDETEDCTSIKGKIDLKDYLISKIPNDKQISSDVHILTLSLIML